VAAPALPAEVQKLREDLLRDQAPSARSRTNYFDPSVFVGRHGRPYSSRRIPISTLMEMRTDAIMRFAQLVALTSIFSAKWKINCTNARKAAFLDQALRRVIGRLIIQYFESWNFGYQAMVKEFGLMVPGWVFIDPETGESAKVWDEGGYPALVWEPCVTLRPGSVAPVWSTGGAFNGIAIAKSGTGGYSLPMVSFADGDFLDVPASINANFTNDDESKTKVDVTHSLWAVNERDSQWGSIWGYPRLGYAFKYWWAYEMTFGILQRAVERHGDPTIVVSYPMGSSNVGGKEVPNQQIAFSIAERARSGSVLAVPSEVWGEDMATANQAAKWKIEYLQPSADFDKLVRVLEYYDTMRFRSMMVSELAIAEGSGGTSSRNVAAETGQRTAESQIFAQAELDELINRYMIPQLADANFPELADVPARKETQAFGADEAALAADLLRSYANSDADKLPIDKTALLSRFQIDALEGPALDRWQQDMAKQAEAAKPEPAPAQPGGAAGVTDSGFYYQAPEHIQLADDEAMLASLPKTKHYSDRAVLAHTRLVRKLWRDLLAEQYEDFASKIEKLDVANLADESDSDYKAEAERVVAGWRFVGKTAAATIKRVALALSKVLARAGLLELSSSRVKTDAWDPDSKDVVAWARNNAAAMVRSVDETTRKQLRTFLASELEAGRSAQEIATNLRAHFAGFPDWRADLIAREETKHYYNAGTLFAAQAVDSNQVQALDARGPGPTDEECVQRNGRFFSIDDAWAESSKEHIRGTLGWRIIPPGTQLSFRTRPTSEMSGVAARVDQSERVIYLVEGLDPEVEGQYLERVAEWFVASS
jgi:hypothetical protein